MSQSQSTRSSSFRDTSSAVSGSNDIPLPGSRWQDDRQKQAPENGHYDEELHKRDTTRRFDDVSKQFQFGAYLTDVTPLAYRKDRIR